VSDDQIGVFVCSWGSGRDPKLDMGRLREYAGGIEGVVLAKTIDRICSKRGQREMTAAIKGSGIDRFVAVACSARTKKQLYRSIAEASGLHPLAFEVAAVREQAAYVHEAAEAQRKAERLVRMAVEKVRLWTPPPYEEEMPVSKNVAVFGDGMLAISLTKELMAQGLTTHLVISGESFRSPPSYIFKNEAERDRAVAETASVLKDPRLSILKRTKLVDFQGPPGDFGLILNVDGEMTPLKCGAVVLAPEPRNELRAVDGSPAPSPQELRERGIKRIAILPSGTSSGVGCSCITPRGMLYALALIESIPGAEVSLLGREVRALGALEDVQRSAQQSGVKFYRIESEPSVQGRAPSIVTWNDRLSGETRLEVDLLLLDAVATSDVLDLARAFEVPVDEKGELLSIDSRLRPGETVRKGVLAARYRVGNMLYEDMALEAGAVAARAAEMLSVGTMEMGGAVAEVDQEKCSACLSCIRLCPYSAPTIGREGKAEVRVELCQGCGSCLALCPSRAIDIYCHSDAQLGAQSRVALGRLR